MSSFEAFRGDVVFEANTGKANLGIEELRRNVQRAYGGMSTDALQAAKIQDQFDRSIARAGNDAGKQRDALLRYRTEMASLGSQTEKTRVEIDQEERSLGRLTRGALAGSGAVRGLGRSLAFASASFLGGAGFVYAIRTAINDASNLHEEIDKTDKVFGDSAASIIRWARDSATALGLPRDKALEIASSFGALLRPLGVSEEKAADTSKTLTQRGADLASFYNTSVEDALQAIQSGLVGQVRPLRRYGVALDAARVSQLALIESGKKHASELTNEEKAYARIQIILHDTALAQGDFARTSGGVANQERILSANVHDLTERIGQGLYPEVNRILHAGNEWLGNTQNQERVQRDLEKALKDGEEVAGALVKTYKTFSPVINAVVSALGGLENAVQAALIFGILNKASRAATGLGLIRLASNRTRAAIVADAAAEVTAFGTVTAAEERAAAAGGFGVGGGGGGGKGIPVVPIFGGPGGVVGRVGQYTGAPAGGGPTPTAPAIGSIASTAITGLAVFPDIVNPPKGALTILGLEGQVGGTFTGHDGRTYTIIGYDHGKGLTYAVPTSATAQRPNVNPATNPAAAGPVPSSLFGPTTPYSIESLSRYAPPTPKGIASLPLETRLQIQAANAELTPGTSDELAVYRRQQTLYASRVERIRSELSHASGQKAKDLAQELQDALGSEQQAQSSIDSILSENASKAAAAARTAAAKRRKQAQELSSAIREGLKIPGGGHLGLTPEDEAKINKQILGEQRSHAESLLKARVSAAELAASKTEVGTQAYARAIKREQDSYATLAHYYDRQWHDASLAQSVRDAAQKKLIDVEAKQTSLADALNTSEEARYGHLENVITLGISRAQLAEAKSTDGTAAYRKAVQAEKRGYDQEIALLRRELANRKLTQQQKDDINQRIIDLQIQEVAVSQKLKSTSAAAVAAANEKQFLDSFQQIVSAYAPNAFPHQDLVAAAKKTTTHGFETVHELRQIKAKLGERVSYDAFPASRYAGATAAAVAG